MSTDSDPTESEPDYPLYLLALELSQQTRELLVPLDERGRWIEFIEERGRRDWIGEAEAAADQILRAAAGSGSPAAITRAVADVIDSIDQMRRFSPQWRRVEYEDGQLVEVTPETVDRFDVIRAEARGRFDRLRVLAGQLAAADSEQPVPAVRRYDQATEDPRPVVLRGPDVEPLVLGKPKPVLGRTAYKAVEALLEAGGKGLTYTELDRKTGVADSRKHLSKLRDSDDHWKRVLRPPIKRGAGGYRIVNPRDL